MAPLRSLASMCTTYTIEHGTVCILHCNVAKHAPSKQLQYLPRKVLIDDSADSCHSMTGSTQASSCSGACMLCLCVGGEYTIGRSCTELHIQATSQHSSTPLPLLRWLRPKQRSGLTMSFPLIAHSFLSRRSASLREEDGAEPQRHVSRSLSAGDLAQASSITYMEIAHASFVPAPGLCCMGAACLPAFPNTGMT